MGRAAAVLSIGTLPRFFGAVGVGASIVDLSLKRCASPVTVPDVGASDEDLVHAMTRGHQAALGELYERHSPRVLLVIRSIVGDGGLAPDLVQEVFLEAWRKATHFDPARGTVRAWLAVRARSRALDSLRTRTRRKESPLDDETAHQVSQASESDVIHLPAALQRLSEKEREVLRLGYFEELTSSEIALVLRLPIGTVKSRTRSGLEKLKEFWKETRS